MLTDVTGGCGKNQVWTSTTPAGFEAAVGDCTNWSTNNNGGIGLAGSVSTSWTQFPCSGPGNSLACTELGSIYCFEQ